MAEPLKKTGTANWSLTYGTTLPFTMHVAGMELRCKAGLVDITGGSLPRTYTTDDLVNGTLSVNGWLTLASNITPLARVWQQVTATSGTDANNLISLVYNTGTGTNAGQTGTPMAFYGVIEDSVLRTSKVETHIAAMIVFRLSGTPAS